MHVCMSRRKCLGFASTHDFRGGAQKVQATAHPCVAFQQRSSQQAAASSHQMRPQPSALLALHTLVRARLSDGLCMLQTMDTFEKQFESLDVQSEFVEGAMSNQAVLSTPEEDVSLLMQQVAVRAPASCSSTTLALQSSA